MTSRIQDLYRRSVVGKTGCWHWQGASRSDGQPAIWTFDHDRQEKRTTTGPRAVWMIAYGPVRPGLVAYRCCASRDCVNPKHMRCGTRAEMVRTAAANGAFDGPRIAEARKHNLRLARAAAGIVDTPDHMVLAVRTSVESESGRSIARRLGLGENVVSRIRRGMSRVEVAAP